VDDTHKDEISDALLFAWTRLLTVAPDYLYTCNVVPSFPVIQRCFAVSLLLLPRQFLLEPIRTCQS